jgi:hypothetical protein
VDASLALANSDPYLVARGLITGAASVNKFGRNIEIDSTVVADVWDGGHTVSSGGTSLIWVAPTQARTHIIASTDAGDTDAGVGARTVEITGLVDWDTAQVSEIVTMGSGSPETVTVNEYVIIHRMSVKTKGATSSNIGEITATAAVDGTVTARIRAGQGQTQMVIYGIPSISSLYMGRLYGNINKASTAGVNVGYADVSIRFNPEPQTELTNFVVRHTFGLSLNGTSALTINYSTPKVFRGPGIIKMQAVSGTADMDISAGFDAMLFDN